MAATAYKEGASIKDNANRHKNSRYMLKMDFSNFFPSIGQLDLISHLKIHLPEDWSDEEIQMIAQLCLWKPKGETLMRLSIGAPSSPLLSNSILYEFDNILSEYCNQIDVAYTRYADDLCFSTNTPDILSNVKAKVKQTLPKLAYPRLQLNQGKTVHTSKKKRRFVTGIIINNEGELSVGRERKRNIRAKLHRASKGDLDQAELRKLNGLISFTNDIEPEYIIKMQQRYGMEVFALIKQASQSDN